MTFAARLFDIQGRIAAAAERVGRAPSEVRLIAVCKRQPAEAIAAAYRAGVRDFGESTAQGLEASMRALGAEAEGARWHFIGRLQTNKVNKVLPHVALLHSVDRPELGEALARRTGAKGLRVLVQVNVGGEAQKGGVVPDDALAFCEWVAARERLRLEGLMALPPADEDPRPHFERMRELSRQLQALPGLESARQISMGMSDDFEVAVECGATFVRVGTALFGPRLQA